MMSDVLRWICDQYRTKLYQTDPRSCRQVDEVMIRVGQSWVCDDRIVDPDDLMTVQEIESRHGITQVAIHKLVQRHGISVRGKRGKWNLYRLGDVLSARSAKKT